MTFAASKAFYGGVSVDQIMQACHWKAHNTFTNFYLKYLTWSDNGNNMYLGPVLVAQQVVDPSPQTRYPRKEKMGGHIRYNQVFRSLIPGSRYRFTSQDVTGKVIFTPQPLRAVGVLFSPMVSGWAGGRPVGRAGGRRREKVCPGCISETVRCRKLILGRDIG